MNKSGQELTHMYRDKQRPKGCETDQNALCGHGSYHAIKTKNKEAVNCTECLKIMKTVPKYQYH